MIFNNLFCIQLFLNISIRMYINVYICTFKKGIIITTNYAFFENSTNTAVTVLIIMTNFPRYVCIIMSMMSHFWHIYTEMLWMWSHKKLCSFKQKHMCIYIFFLWTHIAYTYFNHTRGASRRLLWRNDWVKIRRQKKTTRCYGYQCRIAC